MDGTVIKGERKPLFRLACVHGDARRDDFKWSDWSGVIAVKALQRWTQLEILTGLSTATAILVPAIVTLITILFSLKCLMDERKPKLKTAAQGRSQRGKL